MTIIFSIEGNIGSGKSTLVKKLKNYLKKHYYDHYLIYLQEPVKIWESIKDSKGDSILKKFYQNQEKYAFPFQMMAYISRLSEIKKIVDINPNAIIICERSVWTDKNVFDEFVRKYTLDGIFYVKTDPKKCAERVNIRNREGENIPLAYLEKCHQYHEHWLSLSDRKVLTFDGNVEFIDGIPQEWIDKIEAAIDNEIPSNHKFSPAEKLLIESTYGC
jgi:deoxyadenosine/deoxycytidine kinase